MAVAGIICEYNPFHEGHKYQIRKVRELTGADTIVAVMNGDFVQRGEPAVADKYIRTRMALAEGADMVFELPVRFGLSSAEDFAYGGILALHSLSFVDWFCFGSEGAPAGALEEAAGFFAEEPPEYKTALRQAMREGLSFPAARERAYAECTGRTEPSLFTPNNILGLEYMKSALRLKTRMKPVMIRRTGMGYHETCRGGQEISFLSAAAVRAKLREGEFCGMPAAALEEFLKAPCYLEAEDFWRACSYALRDKWDCLEQTKDISGEMADVFRKNWYGAVSMEGFSVACKTKNITMARIKRCLFQILLGIGKGQEQERRVSYIRLLGMRAGAARYLHMVPDTVVLGRLASDMKRLGDGARTQLQQDIRASDLYRSTAMSVSKKELPEEYKRPVIVVE